MALRVIDRLLFIVADFGVEPTVPGYGPVLCPRRVIRTGAFPPRASNPNGLPHRAATSPITGECSPEERGSEEGDGSGCSFWTGRQDYCRRFSESVNSPAKTLRNHAFGKFSSIHLTACKFADIRKTTKNSGG